MKFRKMHSGRLAVNNYVEARYLLDFTSVMRAGEGIVSGLPLPCTAVQLKVQPVGSSRSTRASPEAKKSIFPI